MENKMEYIVVTLPTGRKNAEEILNELAIAGWRVVCALTDYKLVLEKERKEPEWLSRRDGNHDKLD